MRRYLWIGFLLLLAVPPAYACPILPATIQDVKGNAIADVSVTVYLAGTTTSASLFSDVECTTSTTNPATTDSRGMMDHIYVQDGAYDLLPSKTGYNFQTIEDVIAEDPWTLLTPTYSTSITINRAGAQRHLITVTDTNDFMINAPTGTHKTGNDLWITLKNTSGGAVGTITWNAAFKMAAFTNAATGNRRTIHFKWDGSNWVEMLKGVADIPN